MVIGSAGLGRLHPRIHHHFGKGRISEGRHRFWCHHSCDPECKLSNSLYLNGGQVGTWSSSPLALSYVTNNPLLGLQPLLAIQGLKGSLCEAGEAKQCQRTQLPSPDFLKHWLPPAPPTPTPTHGLSFLWGQIEASLLGGWAWVTLRLPLSWPVVFEQERKPEWSWRTQHMKE